MRRTSEKKRINIYGLVLTAVFTAMTAAATLAIRIPSPMSGYINLGDVIVLVSAWILGPVYGTFAAGVGSMLADFIAGYAAYAPGTLVIKSLCALTACLIFRAAAKKDAAQNGVGVAIRIVSGFFGEAVMVAGYFAYAGLLLGKGLAAAASIPGNCLQAVVGLTLGAALTETLLRNGKIRAYLTDMKL
ncbi:MAG: ECF transporter S component [Clostridia bacterium]|nr:ECF transporter S component [Clostridia bacterium]